MTGPRILVIRLGAMGDVIAALPAVASLKHSIPHSKITWVIEPKWSVLLEGNPYVDSVIHLDRRTLSSFRSAWRELRPPDSIWRWTFRAYQVRSGCHHGAAGAHCRLQRDIRARIAGLLVLLDQSSHPVLSCRGAQSGSGSGSRRVEHPAHVSPAAGSAGRPLPEAISCSRVRWQVGAPSNGRSNTTRSSPNVCGANAGCRW